MFARATVLALLARTPRTATVSPAAMRRWPRRPHSLGGHPVDDAVELFNDSIEAAGGIVACRGPLGNRSLLGSPCEMHPARHGSKHQHTPSHGQPFPRAIHYQFSSVFWNCAWDPFAVSAGNLWPTVCC
jgi:hypothetical protein